MRLVQFLAGDGARRVGLVQDDSTLKVLGNTASVRDLALDAHRRGSRLARLAEQRCTNETVDYVRLVAERRLLPPLDHPDPAHCLISGTGLTHLGSARARDSMHTKPAEPSQAPMTDSMRIFQWGLEGGKPAPGRIGVQPEWFYKGDGACVTPPEQPLLLPPYALDGGEEAEIAGLYVIGDDGAVLRVGFALGNEYSDHIMERQNYLYLAHSKLRTCSLGPEALVGDLPPDICGRVRVLRADAELWSADFLTGEDNMSHTIANLEHHHFKYACFRRPGDVHCHFFGAAVLSFSAGVKAAPGDVFEISAPPFGRALRNPLALREGDDNLVAVQPL
jgi:hypothetical protein